MNPSRYSRLAFVVAGLAFGAAIGRVGLHLFAAPTPEQRARAAPASSSLAMAPSSTAIPATQAGPPCAATANGVAAWNALAMKAVEKRFPGSEHRMLHGCTGTGPRHVEVSVGPLLGMPVHHGDRTLVVLRLRVTFFGSLANPRVGVSPVPYLQYLPLTLLQVRTLAVAAEKAHVASPPLGERTCFVAASRFGARITCQSTTDLASGSADPVALDAGTGDPCARLPSSAYCVTQRFLLVPPMMLVPIGHVGVVRHRAKKFGSTR